MKFIILFLAVYTSLCYIWHMPNGAKAQFLTDDEIDKKKLAKVDKYIAPASIGVYLLILATIVELVFK